METQKYPQIGKLVTYLRADEEGNIIEGSGSVEAILLDPRGRLMVRVKDGEDGFNIDIIAINYDKSSKDTYKELINGVVEITKEGNELVKKTVESYNAKVEDFYSRILGDVIVSEVQLTKERTEH